MSLKSARHIYLWFLSNQYNPILKSHMKIIHFMGKKNHILHKKLTYKSNVKYLNTYSLYIKHFIGQMLNKRNKPSYVCSCVTAHVENMVIT